MVQAETKLLKRVEELVVMADSHKFGQRSSMIVAPLNRISTLVTDSGATEDDLKVFRDAGINVVVAEVSDEDEDKGERAAGSAGL